MLHLFGAVADRFGFGSYRSGRLEVKGEAMHNTRDNLVVTFAANRLSNKEGFFGTSNPFLKISRYSQFVLIAAPSAVSSTLSN